MGQVAVLTVFTPEAFAGPALDFHNMIVGRVAASGRLIEPAQHGTTGGFFVTAMHQLMPNGIQIWNTIYTARWADRGQAMVFSVNLPDVGRKFGPVANELISRIAVPQNAIAGPPDPGTSSPTSQPAALGTKPQAPPCYRPQGIEFCPKPVPPVDQAVPLAGAWIATTAQTSFSVDPSAGGVRSRVATGLIVLFANGVAARSGLVKSGTIDDNYWAEGLAVMDAHNPDDFGYRGAGKWTESNGTVTVQWQAGSTDTFTRDGENLKQTYATWHPYTPVDGLRLEGRYEHPQPFGPPLGISLLRDGRFTEDGVNETMGGATINPGFPQHGSGTYEIARWSLILRFSTGFVQSINLLLGQGDPKDPGDFVLNGYDFARVGGRR
jgi:hypothetical protein